MGVHPVPDPLVLIDDEPVPDCTVDELQLLPIARVIAGAIIGTSGPFTIGIYGEWGEGKTSILQQARSLLKSCDEGSRIISVWFNAWQYEREEHPLVPLVATVIKDIEHQMSDGVGSLTRSARKALSDVSRALRAIAYGFSAKAAIKVPGFADLESGFVAKEMIDRHDRLQTLHDPLLDRSIYFRAFERLGELIGGKGKRGAQIPKIVVFIDDLDRCLPPQVLRLLESIKLGLSQPGFIFVLAVNRRILDGFLRKRYRDDFEGTNEFDSGSSYLDKIVQLPLTLPPHRSRFKSFVRGLLERDALKTESNSAVRQALHELVDLLASGANYNPRSLKRFVNNLIVDRSLLLSLGRGISADSLSLAAVCRILRHHLGTILYNHLTSDGELCRAIAEGNLPDELSAEQSRRVAAARRGRLRREILRRLEDAQFLEELLRTAAGRRWLVDQEAREKMNDFLVVQRETDTEKIELQHHLVENAVRRALQKKPGEKISSRDRDELEILDLSFQPLSDLGAQYLEGLVRLRSLHLSATAISDTGLRYLSPLVNLELLNLNGTRIRGSGLEHLTALPGLISLQLSDLVHEELDLSSILLPASLRRLDLSGNRVLRGLAAILASLLQLEYLDVRGVNLSIDEIEALSQLRTLRHLVVQDQRFTESQIVQVRRALPGCEILMHPA